MKISGFLAILIIILMIITPLMTIGSTLYEINELHNQRGFEVSNDAVQQVIVFSWIVTGVVCLISISAGILLMSVHKPWAVKYCISVVWILGPVSVILISAYFYSEAVGTDEKRKILFQAFRDTLIRSIWPGIITIYFLTSTRVASIYGFGKSDKNPNPVNDSTKSENAVIGYAPQENEQDDYHIVSEDEWVPLITLNGIQDEVEYRRILSVLDNDNIPYKVNKAILVTVFVKSPNIDRAISLTEIKA
jgi:hypothetical protein